MYVPPSQDAVNQGLAAPLKKRCKSFKSGPRAGRQLWLDLLATTLATLRSAVNRLHQRAAELPPEQHDTVDAAVADGGDSAEAEGDPVPMDAEHAAHIDRTEAEKDADKDAVLVPSTAAAVVATAGGEELTGRAPRRKAAAAAAAAVEAERGGPIARSGATPPPATAREQLLQDVLAVMRHCHAFAKSSTFAGQAVMSVNEEPHTLTRIVSPAAASKVDSTCIGCVGSLQYTYCVSLCRQLL